MRKLTPCLNGNTSNAVSKLISVLVLVFLVLIIFQYSAAAQCDASTGEISGIVFNDANENGGLESGESGEGGIMVQIYDSSNSLIAQTSSDSQGNYSFSSLVDGESYRVEFNSIGSSINGFFGSNNSTNVQFVSAPSCDSNFALMNASNCGKNPEVVLTCFAQGDYGENPFLETIVSVEHDFTSTSSVKKYASAEETGAVWGLDVSASQNLIYSAAFVKQYAALTPHGTGAIFKTTTGNAPTTALHVDLQSLGINTGALTVTDVEDCNYGLQVGRMGLGGLALSEDEQFIYVINITNNSLVKVSAEAPSLATTQEFFIPSPGCTDGDARAFALNQNNGKFYVGVTCTAETSQNEANSSIHVYEFDPAVGSFNRIFSTSEIKGFWYDTPTDSDQTMQWLTDIDFTKEGMMLLSLSDRIGHRFCNNGSGRLDKQNPDLLVAWQDNGAWTLESNGTAGSLIGSGVGNGEGPGGGEFFGFDFWPSGPTYHPETALGSVFVLEGSGEVISTNYDPHFNSYSGGLHRYNTSNGAKVSFIELYRNDFENNFGKASGFGDLSALCSSKSIEIGNYVWFDDNSNGIQDAAEIPAAGITLQLIDQNCNVIGTTTTDSNGNYVFNSSNVDSNNDGVLDGLITGTEYFVAIKDATYQALDQTYIINGEEYVICSSDLGVGLNGDVIDSDAVLQNSTCAELNGYHAVSTGTGLVPGGNHNFDIGLCKKAEQYFDLALMKEVTSNSFIEIGSQVSFKISVINQGQILANNYTVTDHIPSGFDFDQSLNSAWTYSNGMASINRQNLAPGQTDEISIVLTVNGESKDFVNFAEISEVTDNDGEPLVDIDSTPDMDPTNDVGGEVDTVTDDETNDDGSVDEDDHDPAMVYVFDLALRKTVVNLQDFYTIGDEVEFEIRVFNQGDVEASSVDVVEYLPNGYVFDAALNPLWSLNANGSPVYTFSDPIPAGASEAVSFRLRIPAGLTESTSINEAEIAFATTADGVVPDFDSTPDEDESNDTGGSPFDDTDNDVSDNGEKDEDDHDPAIINFEIFDLALIKTTAKKGYDKNQPVVYKISIFNQGSITANNISIIDYIPNGLILNDSNWQLTTNNGQNTAERMINIPGGLLPGASYDIYIEFSISPNIGAAAIVNRAEISSTENSGGQDFSSMDIDSTPDKITGNDIGGIPNSPNSDNLINAASSIDEDDEDPEVILVIDSNIEVACNCLDNAAVGVEGQFADILTVTAPSGQNWYIQNVFGLVDYTTLTDLVPNNTTGSAGFVMEEITVLGGGLSLYYMQGLHTSGEGYTIQLTNGEGNFQNLTNPGCSYQSTLVDGPSAVCTNGLVEYSVTPLVGVTYDWFLNGVAVGSGETVEIDFAGLSGVQDVTVTPVGGACIEPTSIPVNVGVANGAIACVQDINISIDGDCETTIVPEMLLSTPIVPGAAYGIMMTDQNGNPINGNVLSAEHVGQTIMVKIIDGCTGNSCWGNITVEDKLAPEIFCEDIEITCNEMLHYTGPLATDNCDGDVEVVLLEELVTVLDCDDPLLTDYIKQIDRKYQAVDSYGNESPICDQTIMVRRLDFTMLTLPDDLTMNLGTALTCGDYDENKNGFPAVSESGVPSIDGVDVYPSHHIYCNVSAGFTDEMLSDQGCVKKIKRTWTVAEWWCTGGNMVTHEQIIEIVDNQAPTLVCPSDIEILTNGFQCQADVSLALPTTGDMCSPDNLQLDLTYPGGFISGYTGQTFNLPVGVHMVTYTVYDGCLNSSSCDITVTVTDDTAPVAVCDQNTVVAINTTGEAVVYASAFDDGSFDDCHLDRMEVLRMDTPNCNSPTSFADHAVFCCDDVGQTLQVRFRVYDMQGNYNECMVNVTVQDKFAPVISCPPNEVIECGADIDFTDQDVLNQMFGEATATDACGATITSTTNINIDQCGVGTVTRTFTASDNNGSASCQQVITISNTDPFDGNDPTELIWPQDYETQLSCLSDDLSPDNLPSQFAYPIINEDQCDLVAATYEDQVFLVDPINNSCFKILRRWTVIDWCQYDGVVGIWNWDQTLVISNFVAPTIDGGCDMVSVCTFDPECNDGYVDLVFTASDDCTPDELLQWTYSIDLNSDGIIDIMNSGLGATIDISGEYQLGMHSIIFEVEDRCGNTMSCTKDFEIINCKPPTAYCINGLSIGLVPMDLDGDGVADAEMAELCVEMVDNGSYHTCGYDVDLSFSADVNDNCITFSCEDVGPQCIELWVTDENGNTSFCKTTIDVQDNNDEDLCDKLDLALINELDTYDVANQVATFNLTVCNQGNGATTKLDVAAYIPSGYTLNDSDWSLDANGDATINLMSSTGGLPAAGIAPGGCFTIPITLDVIPNQPLDDYVLYAEIIGGMDENGLMASDDCDSTPGSNTQDENSVLPNDPDDNNPNGGGPSVGEDEDDHDPAQIPIHDLALRKSTTSSGPYSIGSSVVFEIEIFNQGNQIATNIQLTDYVPCGLDFDQGDNIDWSILSGSNTTTTSILGPLAPGGTATVSIEMTVANPDPGCTGSNYINFAEISDFQDENMMDVVDIDSTPDDNNNNDGPVTNDEIDNGGQDEDDHDPEQICPQIDLTSNATSFCATETVTLTGIPSGGTWSGMGIVNSATGEFDASLVTGGSTQVTYEIDVNCSADLTLNVVDPPSLVLTTPAPVCNTDITGMSTTIDFSVLANIGGSWADTDMTGVDLSNLASVDFTGVAAGTYSFTFTTNTAVSPCTDVSSVISITVMDCNCSCVAGSNDPMCPGEDILLTESGVGGVSWSWTGPNGFTSTLQNPVLTGTNLSFEGIYTVQVTCGNGLIQTCDVNITFMDDTPPTLINCPDDITLTCDNIPDDLSTLGVASGIDNCDGNLPAVVIETNNVSTCNTGFIVRTFVVTDGSGNSAQCSQLITVTNMGAVLTMDDIAVTPDTIQLADCTSLDPDVIGGMPMINGGDDACYNISIDFEDDPMDPMAPLCMDTIDRVWTVIDSCQLNGDGVTGIFTFDQAIVIQDITPPVITVEDMISMECIQDDNTFLAIEATADDCNGVVSITNDSSVGNGTNSASGNYASGTHTITWTATDACGNSSTATTMIEIATDTEPPMCGAIKIFPQIITSTDSVAIIPNDMLISFTDNCTDSINATYAFMPSSWIDGDPLPDLNDLIDTIWVDCDDVSTAPTSVTVVVFDEVGLWDVCPGAYLVEDMNSVCTSNFNVFGEVRTLSDDPLQNVQIELGNSTMPMEMTNVEGEYAFPSLSYGADYEVVPYHNEDPMNGVSTLDLFLIQQHILGVNEFESPYYHIAADINKSGEVSGIDLIELRKLILGIYIEFPHNTSWRHVDVGFEFPELIDPLDVDFPENYNIQSLNSDMEIDFVGVKIGDVNGSVDVTNFMSNAKAQNRQIFNLRFEDAKVRRGDKVQVDLVINEDIELAGFQLALSHMGLSLIDVQSDHIELRDNNWIQTDSGSRLSWFGNGHTNLNKASTLISFIFEAEANVNLASQLAVQNDYMNAEIYLGKDLQIRNLDVRPFGEDEAILIFQNSPNPWKETTSIYLESNAEGNAELLIHDAIGKLIVKQNVEIQRGLNVINIDESQVIERGIYFYTITKGAHVYTKQMIKI